MATEFKIPRKLIEVALPLDAINIAAAKEKSIRFGHPSTLHLWWARRPLAAARAILFAQMVNDPGYQRNLGRGLNKQAAQAERDRLFKIIEELVKWENINNVDLLKEANEEIWKSWKETCSLNHNHPNSKELFNPSKIPGVHDPFAGGGAIPLEAQRLMLESTASDLNPVAVLINKAMIEIPPLFKGKPPVFSDGKNSSLDVSVDWEKVSGLADDIAKYGNWMRDRAIERIGNIYPDVKITKSLIDGRDDLKPYLGQSLKVITWLWARTVRSPSPIFSDIEVPLISSYILSSKEGQEYYLEPIIEKSSYTFLVRSGKAPKELENGTKLARGANFKCILSNTPIEPNYIKNEGINGRHGTKLIAIVVDSPSGRLFIPPIEEHEIIAKSQKATWKPEQEISGSTQYIGVRPYGINFFSQLFTERQLKALNTYQELIEEAKHKCYIDFKSKFGEMDKASLRERGRGAKAYSEAVAIYLSLGLSRLTDICNAQCRWESSKTQVRNLFGRQAIPMMWDFAENNVFGEVAGDFQTSLENLVRALRCLPANDGGIAIQANATLQTLSKNKVVSTDPPYYDNVPYSDLSDFFYVWLQRSLKGILPDLFELEIAPKKQELVAFAYRHNNKAEAEVFFLDGMTEAMSNISKNAHPAFPITIYYAFKQSEIESDDLVSNTGWEVFLEAINKSGMAITGTWPLRTELSNRMRGSNSNALASSIVLVCERKKDDAPVVSRRDFVRELNSILPEALEEMTHGAEHSPVAPVDLSQAIIGPGMAVFGKYSAVLEADGKPMSIKTALQLINRFLAEEDFDHDTQFCLSWYEGHGWENGKFGEADVLARAKGTSVDGLKQGGVLESSGGNVRLLRFNEYNSSWNPENDSRLSTWEILHQMIRLINTEGETAAGEVLSKTGRYAESIRTLAYRLYTIAERRGWAQEAGYYNNLAISWSAIETSANSLGYTNSQTEFFGELNLPTETSDKKTKKTGKKK